MSSTAMVPRKHDTALAYILWCGMFFGLSGLHRLYMGRIGSGLLWLFTGGLCGVGQVIDLVMMPRMIEDSDRGAGW